MMTQTKSHKHAKESREQDEIVKMMFDGGGLVINKRLLAQIGPIPAVYLTTLLDAYRYFKKEHILYEGQAFYLTHEAIQAATLLGEEQIRRCKKMMGEEGWGLFDVKMVGSPAKEHYFLNLPRLRSVFKNGLPDEYLISEDQPSSNTRSSYSNFRGTSKTTPSPPPKTRSYINNKLIKNKEVYSELQTSSEEGQTTPSTTKQIVTPTSESCRRIVDFWNRQTHTIKVAKYTATLDKKLTARLKKDKWTPTQVMRAIAHYEEVVECSGYYKHRWTLLNFLSQSNGAPRFTSGLDDKYSGDLWLNYNGTKKESIASRSSNAGESATLFNASEFFAEELTYHDNELGVTVHPHEQFLRDVYNPAVNLIRPETPSEREELASALADRFTHYRDRHAKMASADRRFLSPLSVLKDYVEWLEDQTGLTHLTPRVFAPRAPDKLFNQFFDDYVFKALGYWIDKNGNRRYRDT